MSESKEDKQNQSKFFRIEENTNFISPNLLGSKKNEYSQSKFFWIEEKTNRVSQKFSGSKKKRTEFVRIFHDRRKNEQSSFNFFRIKEKTNMVSSKFSGSKKKTNRFDSYWARKSWKKTKVRLFLGRRQKTKALDPKKDEVLPLLLDMHEMDVDPKPWK